MSDEFDPLRSRPKSINDYAELAAMDDLLHRRVPGAGDLLTDLEINREDRRELQRKLKKAAGPELAHAREIKKRIQARKKR